MPNRTTNCTVCLLQVIGSGGTSSSTKELQARARAVFSEYKKATPTAPQGEWKDLPEGTRATRDIYEKFAHYLMHGYVIPLGKRNAGKHLDSSTSLPYLNSLIHQAAADYVSSKAPFPTIPLLLSCLFRIVRLLFLGEFRGEFRLSELPR